MPTRRTTTAAERIDLHLLQAEQFLELDLLADATRRFRAALAQCDLEARSTIDPMTHVEIAQRRAYASDVLRRLGVRPQPDRSEHATL